MTFIVIEGPDGVGKSTLCAALAEATGGTVIKLPGDETRAKVAAARTREEKARLFLSEMAAIEFGDGIYIADRWAVSTLVYQGWGAGNDAPAHGDREFAIAAPDLHIVIEGKPHRALGGDEFEDNENYATYVRAYQWLRYAGMFDIVLDSHTPTDNQVETILAVSGIAERYQ